jgi:hypothetical protein
MLKTEIDFGKVPPPRHHGSYSNRLLMPDSPLQVLPTLAVKIGLNEAIVLQQVHYWVSNELNKNLKDGRKWVYNTYVQWRKQFPFWSYDTIKRTIQSLESKNLLITERLNSALTDRTKWYTVNYEELDKLESTDSLVVGTIVQNALLQGCKMPSCNGADCPDARVQNALMQECKMPSSTITETTTEITTEINPLLPREKVIRKSFDTEFEEFWAINPKPVDKTKAREVFNRLLGEDYGNFQKIMTGRRAQNVVIELEGTERKYIKGPAAWLRSERFNDEIQTEEQLREEHQRSISKSTSQPARRSKGDQYHANNAELRGAIDRKAQELIAEHARVTAEIESARAANEIERAERFEGGGGEGYSGQFGHENL